MYARLVRFSLAPGKQAAAQKVADDIGPLIAAQPGYEGLTVFADDRGEAGLFVIWDTEEHANAAAQIVRPKLDEHLSGNLQRPPDARLFKVLSK